MFLDSASVFKTKKISNLSVENGKYLDTYNKILGHADAGNKQAVTNLTSDQIKELSSQLESDEGFWAPIRNNTVVNQYIRRVFNEPNLGEKYDNFIKLSPSFSNFYAAVGAIDQEGNQIQPKEGGNGIVNGISGVAGDLAKFALMGQGIPGGLGFGTTEKVANELVIKNTGAGISSLPKAAQIATKLSASGAEMGYFSGVSTEGEGGDFKDVLKSTREGFVLGAGLRGVGIGAKYAIPKIQTGFTNVSRSMNVASDASRSAVMRPSVAGIGEIGGVVNPIDSFITYAKTFKSEMGNGTTGKINISGIKAEAIKIDLIAKSGEEGINGEVLKGVSEADKLTINVVNGERYIDGKQIKINQGQQDKHIVDTHNYNQAVNAGKPRSILSGDSEQFLNDYAGTGQKISDYKERVDFGETIGQYYDPTTGTYTDTTIGTITYGKNGAHIIPARPK